MSHITKLNSSTEKFPNDTPIKKNKEKMILNSVKVKQSSYMMDPLMFPRVKQYINENKYNHYFDIDKIVDELQKKYREYARRKRNAFKICVQKAFNDAILEAENDLIKSNDEIERDNVYVSSNSDNINSSLKNSTKIKKKTNDKELINISSDEDIKDHSPRTAAPPSSTISVGDLSGIAETPSNIIFNKLTRKRKSSEAFSLKNKKLKTLCPIPGETFADFGGIENIPKKIRLYPYQITFPCAFQKQPTPRILICGPPGSGKTFFVHCMAGQYKLPLIFAKDLIGGVSGESEQRIRNLFKEAEFNAPCILFLDEVDTIAGRRDKAQSDMGRRIVVQLMTCLDELGPGVLVIGTTSRADSLDPALRSGKRFNEELYLGIPSREQRETLLNVIFKEIKIDPDIKFSRIAEITPGYVAGDLKSLLRECVINTFMRVYEEKCMQVENSELVYFTIEQLTEFFKDYSFVISKEDLDNALKCVKPSALREGFATVPDVTWDNIGSLGEIRNILHSAILAPIKNPKLFTDMGLTVPIGILLCGPPGCGKTLLAKAIANETGLNFISVRGPELLNMYLGESERAVRQVFERARNSSPCVIFFDEIDALCSRRSNSSNDASARIVSQMLTEMDGLNSRKDVFVIAATNRPEIVDPAILRPGRLDKILYVGLPSAEDRKDILKTITKTKPRLDSNVNLDEIANDSKTDGYSGADLAALVREASLYAISEGEESPKVTKYHFDKALTVIRRSVSEKDKKYYEKIKKIYGTNLSNSPIHKGSLLDRDISKNLESDSCDAQTQNKDNLEEQMETND